MKDDPGKEAVRRLQALITRETGAPLKHAAETEMESIIQYACGADGEGDAAGPEHSFVRREVTILLADLRGFTSITATLPAGTVIATLNRPTSISSACRSSIPPTPSSPATFQAPTKAWW